MSHVRSSPFTTGNLRVARRIRSCSEFSFLLRDVYKNESDFERERRQTRAAWEARAFPQPIGSRTNRPDCVPRHRGSTLIAGCTHRFFEAMIITSQLLSLGIYTVIRRRRL